MSATSKTGRAALVAANGRARRPAEPPQGDLSHAEAQRDRERRDMFWFGNAPEGWSVGKMRSVVYERREKYNRNEELIILSLLKDVGVIPYSEKGEIGNKSKEDHSQYKVARKGDLVINSMNVIIGSVGISPYDGYISPAYYSFVPREDTCMGYIGYLCSTRRFQRAVRCYAKGIMEIRLRVSSYDFLSMPIPLPPLPEQKAIVAYLDAETGRIDKAIAAEEKMIAHLQERLQGVLRAPWDVAEATPCKTWESRRAKFIWKQLTAPSSSLRKIGLENIESFTGRFIESASQFEGSGIAFEKGDILYGKLRPYLAKVWIAEFAGNAVGDFFVYRLNDGINARYLHYYMRSPQFTEAANASTYGAKMPRVSADYMANFPIPLPPLPEQAAIVERLDRETGKIDRAIEVKRRQIELLRERRQIVIDEVVTGKVKVA